MQPCIGEPAMISGGYLKSGELADHLMTTQKYHPNQYLARKKELLKVK